MSNITDFQIKKKELEKYTGHGTDITVPDKIISIGFSAFSRCTTLKSIIIPEGVISIGENAFSGCTGLESIVIPKSITSIGGNAFSGCTSLETIIINEGVTSIWGNAFDNCVNLKFNEYGNAYYLGNKNNPYIYLVKPVSAEIESLEINADTKCICQNAFKSCGNLREITIPCSSMSICEGAFYECASLKRVYLQDNFHHINFNENCFSRFTKFVLPYNNIKDAFYIPKFILINVFLTAEETAYVLLYRSEKGWNESVENSFADPFEVIKCLCDLIGSGNTEEISDDAYKRIFDYVVSRIDFINKDAIESLYDAISGIDEKQAELFYEEPEVNRKRLNDYGNINNEIDVYAEKYRFENRIDIPHSIFNKITSGIHYADGSGECSAKTLQTVIAAYENFYESHFCVPGAFKTSRVLNSYPCKIPEADHIAEALDRKELNSVLSTYADDFTIYRPFILAYGRYMTDSKDFIAKMKTRRNGDTIEKLWAENAKGALYLNYSIQAAEYFLFNEENDTPLSIDFSKYAEVQGLAVSELRDVKMLRYYKLDDFDAKCFDIGNHIIEATTAPDLRIRLFDRNKMKVIKYFPRKSDNEKLLDEETQRFEAFKKDMGSFLKKRYDILMSMYWSGEKIPRNCWEYAYLNHFILKKTAPLLIWKDKTGNTFTVYHDKIIDINGNEYSPSDGISIAHVFDMKQSEISSWQKFLSDKNIRQLFDQTREPVVIDKSSDEDLSRHFDEIVITKKQRKKFKDIMDRRGIKVSAETIKKVPGSGGTIRIHKDIKIKYRLGSFIPDFILGEMSYGDNKKALNCVIYNLDRITVKNQIKHDRYNIINDIVLGTFTETQINELLNYARDVKAVNCIASLMEYKRQKFGFAFNMDDFTLDW